MAKISDYPRPALTADIVLFRFLNSRLQTLLIKRGKEPYKDHWAYPGGFVDEGENGLQAAFRELEEETSIKNVSLRPLLTDTELNRDPRGWTVSVVYYGFVNQYIKAVAGDDAKETQWFEVNMIPKLAFDHELLFRKSIEKLRNLLKFKAFGKELLPGTFLMDDLLHLYNAILNCSDTTQRIVNRLLNFGVLNCKGEHYCFEQRAYDRVYEEGFL